MRRLPATPKQEQAAHSMTVASAWGWAARFSQARVRFRPTRPKEKQQRTSGRSYLFRYARAGPAIHQAIITKLLLFALQGGEPIGMGRHCDHHVAAAKHRISSVARTWLLCPQGDHRIDGSGTQGRNVTGECGHH